MFKLYRVALMQNAQALREPNLVASPFVQDVAEILGRSFADVSLDQVGADFSATEI